MKAATLINSPAQETVLELNNLKAVAFQSVMIGSAVILPAVCHLSGAPVRWLLPMHWSVILAGLVYGWRGGLIVGLAAPALNWLITGYPLPAILPAMTVELSIYGLTCGLFREYFGLNSFLAVTVALVSGRVFFVLTVLLSNAYDGAYGVYLLSAMIPGVFAGALQILSLPFLARLFVNK